MRHQRMPKAKPGQLVAKWATGPEREVGHWSTVDMDLRGDLAYAWGEGCDKIDTYLLHYALARKDWDHGSDKAKLSVLEELVARAYDLSTLRFSVSKKKSGGSQ